MGLLRDENGAGSGQLLHTGREVGRVAHGHVVGMQVIFPDGAHDDLARVDADAHQERRPPLLTEPICIPPHLLLHAQGGIEGTLWVIFVGNRRAKQRKDAVPQGLRHIPIIAMDGVHHELQSGIDDGTGVFGIESFNQRGRAFEVSKDGGDGLTLAIGCTAGFHGRLLGPDVLGQVRRGVTNGSSV